MQAIADLLHPQKSVDYHPLHLEDQDWIAQENLLELSDLGMNATGSYLVGSQPNITKYKSAQCHKLQYLCWVPFPIDIIRTSSSSPQMCRLLRLCRSQYWI